MWCSPRMVLGVAFPSEGEGAIDERKDLVKGADDTALAAAFRVSQSARTEYAASRATNSASSCAIRWARSAYFASPLRLPVTEAF